MFEELSSDDSRFKTVHFQPGLNVLVADKSQRASGTDSRNSAGKSSLIELLHFALGAKADNRNVATRKELRTHTFTLRMDWPGVESPLLISRSAAKPSEVRLDPDVAAGASGGLGSAGVATLSQWQAAIERDLFGLVGDHPGVTGRAMLSFYLRRINSHAFNEPARTYPQQSLAEASANLAYLLGLDWQLAGRYKQLSVKEATRRRLSQASSDPVWGRIVGKSSELRGQITLGERRVEKLRIELDNFRVVPEYEALQGEADRLGALIRQSRLDDVVDRRNLQDILNEIDAEGGDRGVDYLRDVYGELGVVLGDQVRQRYEAVAAFHASMVENRRLYLEQEASDVRSRLEARAAERQALGERQASILRTLNDGGALTALTALQSAYAAELSALEALRHRYEAAAALESSKEEIAAARLQLQAEMRADLDERRKAVDDAVVLFSECAAYLYGDDRPAYLEFDPDPTALRITPRIASDQGRGVGNMAMFCFDWTVAVIAHRSRRGPDFLAHDSHLFDGVDERQVARAMQLAERLTSQERMQYVMTINSDDLEKAGKVGAPVDGTVIEPRLTDAYDEGGLFGFRLADTPAA